MLSTPPHNSPTIYPIKVIYLYPLSSLHTPLQRDSEPRCWNKFIPSSHLSLYFFSLRDSMRLTFRSEFGHDFQRGRRSRREVKGFTRFLIERAAGGVRWCFLRKGIGGHTVVEEDREGETRESEVVTVREMMALGSRAECQSGEFYRNHSCGGWGKKVPSSWTHKMGSKEDLLTSLAADILS